MSRVQTGVDLVAVERVERLVERYERAAARLFTERELEYCNSRPASRYEHMAARFAAKEAVLKAFGTGKQVGMRWTDVEVVTAPGGGRPGVRLDGAVASFAEDHGLSAIDVSLSHTGGLALALAVTLWDASPYSGESQL